MKVNLKKNSLYASVVSDDYEEAFYPFDPGEKAPDEVFDAFSDKPTLLIPSLQGMDQYIRQHWGHKLIAYFCNWVEHGDCCFSVEETPEAFSDTAEFERMKFWRLSRSVIQADIPMVVDVSFSEEGNYRFERINAFIQLTLDMDDLSAFNPNNLVFKETEPLHADQWQLTEYLIPIIGKDEIEFASEDFLYTHCFPAWLDQHKNNSRLLADRMGLQVKHYHLHGYEGIKSVIFFKPGKITIEHSDPETKTITTEIISVPQKTILLNDNAIFHDCVLLEIYHECIHYDWHYAFYKLQDLHNNDLRLIKKRWKVCSDKTKEKDPVSWMEWQANRGSCCLHMPKKWLLPLIQEKMAHFKNKSCLHHAQQLASIARDIAEEYDIPRRRIRGRMIQLGYVQAKGIFNFIEKKYTRPFCFDAASCYGQHSFFITPENVAKLYREELSFREYIDSEDYVYAEGLICRNHPDYIRQTPDGPILTEWANAHVDQCCLRFADEYIQSDVLGYRHGRMYCDEKYNRHYLYFPPVEYKKEKDIPSESEQIVLNKAYRTTLIGNFPQLLKKLMKDCKVTEEVLCERTGIPVRTISRLKNNPRNQYPLHYLIAIIIGLHLPPWVSTVLLKTAHIDLDDYPDGMAYSLVIKLNFMDTLEQVQTKLVGYGASRLDLNDAAA